jgi:putative flippase GtrA
VTDGLSSLLQWRLARFVVVGAGANALLFVLVFLFHRLGAPAFWAGVTAYAIAFGAAYLAQRGWTFGGAHSHRRAFPRYLAAQLVCAVASGAVGHICVAVFDAPPLLMSAAVTVTAGITSYLLSSLWVFPAAEQGKPTAASR